MATASIVAAALAAAALVACSGGYRDPVEGEMVIRHTVEPGETLESVADEYYGDPRRARDIRRFNELKEDDLAAGVELRIPLRPEEVTALEVRKAARIPYNEGLGLARRGDYLDAAAQFRSAIELDPGFADAYFNLGVTYQRMKAYERARDALDEAVDRRPDNAAYRYAMGNAEFHLERYDQALRAFRKALELDPDHLRARFSLAATLEKQGKFRDAVREWERYLELDADSEWADEARTRLQALRP